MKYYRFMSLNEMSKLSAGMDIVGKRHYDCRTNSVGVCFLGEKTVDNNEHEYSPIECYEFLSGIVSDEVLVEFESSLELKTSYGIYADPYGMYEDLISITEYNHTMYNRETMKPLRYAMVDNYSSNWAWYDFN